MLIPAEVLAQERKHERISALVTILFMAVFFLMLFFFEAYRRDVKLPGKKYEVVGAIDFGDFNQGSRNINSFERSVPDPVTPKPQAAAPAPAPEQAETTPPPTPPITTPKPTPVTQPDPPKTQEPPKPVPTPPKTTQPQETKPAPPTPDPKPTPTPSESSTSDQPQPNSSSQPSGANQGNASSGTGNSGTPNVKVLDPDGMYSFGTGSGGGLNGWQPLSLNYPTYDVQEEGKLKFKFWINSDGSVTRVQALPTNKIGLKQRGINAIRTWRFKAPSNFSGGQAGPFEVTITFKLKG